jgi:hypothetical protein
MKDLVIKIDLSLFCDAQSITAISFEFSLRKKTTIYIFLKIFIIFFNVPT